MNKKIIFLFAILILLCGCCVNNEETKTITIKTNTSEINLNVGLAITESEITRGLMYRKSLAPDSGILFIFPDEDYRIFWMKNTLIPLDIMFMAGNGTIVDIKTSFQPCTHDPCPSYRSKEKAMYVLEANAGLARENDIQEGNAISVKQ